MDAEPAAKNLHETGRVPDAEEFLLSTPLYRSVPADGKLLSILRRDGLQFDCYCVECERDAPFKTLEFTAQKIPQSLASVTRAPASPSFTINGSFSVTAVCQRNPRHVYNFYFRLRDGELVKVGQWPSLEDITGGDLIPFRSLLSGARFAELKRATGLASHGVGIGAFVYLRRIFEGLIREHHDLLIAEGKPVAGWDDMRMEDKVGALSDVLPSSLVANKAAYSILSAGIHELDEDTCKKHFPFIRQAIIVILRDDLRKREEQNEAKKLQHELGRIVGEVRVARKSPARTKKSDHASHRP